MVTIIIPTYNEATNISILLPRIERVALYNNLEVEIIVVDDNSTDGTAVIASRTGEKLCVPVQILSRTKERGLSSAVIAGFKKSKGDILLIMDADLSHPCKKIPEMIFPIKNGKADACIGSRYIKGGGSQSCPVIRKIISKSAGFLAKGLVNVSDPTTGFMAIKAKCLEGVSLEAIGWKIVLEILVKTKIPYYKIKEVPIVFKDRINGKSKLSLKTDLLYLLHLKKLYIFKFKNLIQFIKYYVVGTLGMILDILILYSCVELLGISHQLGVALGFITSVNLNFYLNSRWTFKNSKKKRPLKKYGAFILLCFFGMTVRVSLMYIFVNYLHFNKYPDYLIANFFFIIFLSVIMFFGVKLLVFGKSTLFINEESKK